jgi:hypothetical protein
LPLEILRTHVAFFDPQEQVGTTTTGLVGGDLFNLEIFGYTFDPSADPRQVGCQKRRTKKGIESHGSLLERMKDEG